MHSQVLDYQLEAARGRLEALRQQAGPPEGYLNTPLAAALEELSIALEELQVSAKELRQQNQELAASRERLELVLGATNDGIWDHDLITDDEYVSDRWLELLGYQRAEWDRAGETWLTLLHPDDRERVFEGMRRYLEARAPYDFECRMRTKDGAYRWFRARGQAAWDAAGKPLRLAGSIGDITGRKRAEEALKESEARLAEAQRIAHIGHWTVELPGFQVTWSAEVYRIFGVPPDQFEGTQAAFLSFIHPDDRQAVWQATLDAFRQHKSYAVDHRILRPDGTERIVHEQGEIVYDEAGKPRRIFGTVQDITECERTFRALWREREFISAVLDTAGACVVVLDRQGRIVRFNQAAERISGYSFAEVQGKPIWDLLIPPEEMEAAKATFGQLSAGQYPNGLENHWVSRDRSRHLIQWSNTVLLDPAGRVEHIVATGIDVTERQRAEQALQESEAKYRLLVENQTDMLVKADTEGHLTFVSPSYCKVFGKSEAELVGAEFMPRVHPHDREATSRALTRLIQPPYTYYVEQRALTATGWRWLAWSGKATFDQHGQLVGNTAVGRDITERKQAEEALQRSEECYRAVVQDQTELISRWRTDGTNTFANEAYYRFYAKSPQELVGQDWLLHVAEEDREAVKEARQCWLASVTPANPVTISEHREVMGTGEKRWLQWTRRALFDEQGHVVEVQSVGRDVTERKLAQEALIQSEYRFRSIAEQSSDAIMLTDEGGNLIVWNRSAEQITGLPRDQVLGRPVWETHLEVTPEECRTPDSDQLYRRLITDALATGRMAEHGQPDEIEIRRADGVRRVIQESVFAIPGGQGYMMAGISRDVTERRQAEEEVRQSNRRLRILHEVDRAILAARSEQTIARVVLRHIRELIPCQGAAIIRFDFERGEAGVVAANLAGERDWPRKRRFSLEGLDKAVARLRRGRAVRTEDVLALPQLPPALEEAQAKGIRSMLNLPLITQAGLVGVLNLSADAPSAFTAESEEIARQLAASVAIGIQQADLSGQLRGRLSELKTVHRAGRRLQQLHMPEALADTISEVIRESVRHDYADVLLVDQPSGRLVPFVSSERAAITAIAEAAKAYQLARASHPTASVTGLVARSGQSLRLGDVRRDKRYVPLHGRVRSELCVPLRAGNEIIGVINLEARRYGAYGEAEQRLLETVAVPIAVAIQNARLYEQVSAGGQRLRALSRQLLTAQEAERKRIASELHDEIGQALTAVILNLQSAQRKLGSPTPALLHECIGVVQSALEQVRSLSLDLRPAALDDLGLVQAMQWYISRQSQRAGFAATFKATPPALRPAPEVAIVCYRVVQEALTNVVRHAHAHRVGVELLQGAAELELVICDDGVGFDVAYALQQAGRGTSMGLLGLQERVAPLGGRVEITSTPGSGTQIRVRIPWQSTP